MGGQSFKADQRYASRESESESEQRVAEQIALVQSIKSIAPLVGVSSQEAIDRIAPALTSAKLNREQCADVAARLERVRPLRDRFASQIAAENAPLDAYTNLSRSEALGLLRERDRQLELAWRELADLRAALPSGDPTGAHPYRSAPSSATAAPSRPVAASVAQERVDGRSCALRRVYGALERQWPFTVAAVGFALASAHMFAWSSSASGALAGLAGAALVRIGAAEAAR